MKKETEGDRIRKAYAIAGTRSQKMMSFRCDLDIIEWLNSQPNKGRYINELVRLDMIKKKK